MRSSIRGIWAGFVYILMATMPVAAQVQFEVKEFIIEGRNPIGQRSTSRVLDPFLGAHNGIEQLQQAVASLEAELIRKGYHFHRVTLPPQVLESGSVTLEIGYLVVGQISTSGNKHFSDANLRRSVPQLKQGETPNTRALSRALGVANFNSAKRTRLTFSRGSEVDTLDARIEIQDRSPHQTYGWLNNTGTENTTRSRIGVGYQHRNLFDRDHTLTATYTTSPERPEDVQQYGINIQIPVYPITGTVGLFYIDSDINSGRVAEFFDVNGGGATTGIRYSQVLNKLGEYQQRAHIDVVDKLFDNNIAFQGTEIGNDVRSRPLSLTWQLEWDRLSSSGGLNVSWATNLNGGSLNDQASYTAARTDAPQNWNVIRINYKQDFKLPKKWLFDLSIQSQYTNAPLISGEQLGLGGSRGPRGFEEREVGVDRGTNLKFQLWAPPFHNNLLLGTFADYASGTALLPLPGTNSSRELISIGASAKWQWSNRLVTTLDVGHVLEGFDEPDLTQDGYTQAHVSLVYRFNWD